MLLECTDCEEDFEDFLGYSVCEHCRRVMELELQYEQELELKYIL